MSIPPGNHRFGPDNATLRVETGRRGAAAKAGHDLVIHVTSWQAALDVGEQEGEVRLELDADAGSLRVHEGTGGVQPLKDEDKDEIHRTIGEEVLGNHPIRFRSTAVEVLDEGRLLRVRGVLEIARRSEEVDFELRVGDEGRIAAGTTIKQTDWGIKPYSGLFGALRVADEVDVLVEADLAAER